MRGRQFFGVCCFKSFVCGILVVLFHYFKTTLIGYTLWSRCAVNSLLYSAKSVFLVHVHVRN